MVEPGAVEVRKVGEELGDSNDLSVIELHGGLQRALGEQGQHLESDFSMLRMDPPKLSRLRR